MVWCGKDPVTDATTNEHLSRMWGADCRCSGTVPEMRDTDLIVEARDIMRTERQGDYGPPEENMGRTAEIWSGILGVPITARQVALCLVGVKLAREGYRHKHDNLVDGVAYLLIAEQLS